MICTYPWLGEYAHKSICCICAREFIQQDMITKAFYIYVNYLLMSKTRHMYMVLKFIHFEKLNTYKIDFWEKIRDVYPK